MALLLSVCKDIGGREMLILFFSVYLYMYIYIERGSYRSGHFILNLWNEPMASFINFIRNDHNCKILCVIWPFKMGVFCLQTEHCLNKKMHSLHRRCQWCYLYAPNCYYMCGHTIFTTQRYPLNNSKCRMINLISVFTGEMECLLCHQQYVQEHRRTIGEICMECKFLLQPYHVTVIFFQSSEICLNCANCLLLYMTFFATIFIRL